MVRFGQMDFREVENVKSWQTDRQTDKGDQKSSIKPSVQVSLNNLTRY